MVITEFLERNARLYRDETALVEINPSEERDKAEERGNALISFDYADRLDHPLVESTLPYVDIGFYSYQKDKDDFIKNFLKDKVARGMKVAVATFGEQGSLAWDGKEFVSFGIIPAKQVVNTVGAGDSFIAGFLHGYLNHWKRAPVWRPV